MKYSSLSKDKSHKYAKLDFITSYIKFSTSKDSKRLVIQISLEVGASSNRTSSMLDSI